MSKFKTVAIAMLLTGLATTVQAMDCAPRDMVVKTLTDRFGENFSGGGLQDDTAIYEVWTSKDAGTWTILMTRADGLSCIMAEGTDWLPQLDRHVVQGVPS